jgi:hypothetical protein
MRLVISSADPVLSRTLYLEAKRLLLLDACPDATLFLVDLDHPDPAVTPDTGAVCVGFSAAPAALSESSRATLSALLSLPFSAKEFGKTLSALFPRRADCFLICGAQSLLLGGESIRLSKTEAALFSLLYENRDRVVSDDEIAALLGESTKRTNTAAVYLYRLRRKLSADGRERIRTVRGEGARWVGETALCP